VRGILEGVAGAVALGGLEEETVFRALRKSSKAGFAIDICADLEVHAVEAPVGNANFDFGVVNGFAVGVSDDEGGGARAQAGVHGGDRVGIGLGISGRGQA